jgi:hypothetical protein
MTKKEEGETMVSQPNRQLASATLITIIVALTVNILLVSTCYAYEELIDRQAGIRVSSLPIYLSRGKQVRIRVWISVRLGDLNKNPLKTSTLVDNQGNEYHLISLKQIPSRESQYAGDLLFPVINDKAKVIKLLIKEVGGVETRVFEWALQ